MRRIVNKTRACIQEFKIKNRRSLGIGNWGKRWHSWSRKGLIHKRLREEVDILKPPYSTRYPELVKTYNIPSNGKRDVIVKNNVFIDEPVWKGRVNEKNSFVMKGDPGFENMKTKDFRLKKDSTVFKKLAQFKSIPFNKMGLYLDKYRKVLPEK